MDPSSAAALVALLTNGGPWALVVVGGGIILRVWRSGEFLPKNVHDLIVQATTQRYSDLLDRFNNQQDAIKLWRENAERAQQIAATSQAQHTEAMARLAAIQKEIEEFRDDFHGARVWSQPIGGDHPGRTPPPRPSRRDEGA